MTTVGPSDSDGRPPGGHQDTLQVLLYDYYITREDEQQFQTILATLISVAVALLAAIIALFYQSCDLNPSSNCLHIRPIVYAGLPFGPLVILAYLGVLANVATVRNFYLRALERQLHEYAEEGSVPLEGSALLHDHGQTLPVPMFTHLVHLITSQRHGLLRYRYLTFWFYVAMAGLFLGVTVTSLLLTKSLALQVIMGLAYGVTTIVFLLVLWSGSLGGRALWQQLTERLEEARLEPLIVRDHIPSRLWSYLLLPRPAELITKGLFVPVSAIIGLVVFSPGRAWSGLDLVVFVLAFEYLAYQARYILNDIRNLDEDARDPMAASRNRLPQPMSPRMLEVTIGVMMARVLGWMVAIVWLWSAGLGFPLLVSGVAVFVIAVLYEELRVRVRKATDREGFDILASTLEKSALYIVVGFGYALRAVTGIWIGGRAAASLTVLLATAVSMSAFGTMFVVMTWVIVGTSFIEPLIATPAFPSRRCAKSLVDKSHYGPLLSRAGLLEDPLTLEAKVGGAPRERPFLNSRSHGLDAIWNRAFLTGAAAAGVLGLLLAHGSRNIPVPLLAFALVLAGISAAGAVSIGPGPLWRFVLTWLAPALLLVTVAWFTHQRFWWISSIPFAAVCVVYTFFCWSRAADLVKWSQWPMLAYELVVTKASRMFERSAGAVFGPSAIRILLEGRRREGS